MKKSVKLLFLAIVISIIAVIIAKNNAKADNVMPTELTVGSTIIVKYDVMNNCESNIHCSYGGGVQLERVNSSGQTWNSDSDSFDGAFYYKYTFSNVGSATVNCTAESRRAGYLCTIQYEQMNINIVEGGTRSDVGVVTANKTQTEYSIMESDNAITSLSVNVNDSSKRLTTNLSGDSITWSSGNTSILTIDQNGNITPVAVGKTAVRVTKNENEWIEIPVEITTRTHADVAVNGVVELCFDVPSNWSHLGFSHPFKYSTPNGGNITAVNQNGRQENGKWILDYRLDTAGTYTFYDFELEYTVEGDSNTYKITYDDVVEVVVGEDGEETKSYNINQRESGEEPSNPSEPSEQQADLAVNGVIDLCFEVPSNWSHLGFTHPFSYRAPNGANVTGVTENGRQENGKWILDYRLDTAGTYKFYDFELEYKLQGDEKTYTTKYYDVIEVVVGENGASTKSYNISKIESDQFVTIPEGQWNITNNSADVEVGKSLTLTYTFPQGIKKYQIKAIASDSDSENGVVSIGSEFGTVTTQTYTYDNSTATTQLVVKIYGVEVGTRTINFAQLGNITNADNQENCTTTIPSVTINVTPVSTNLTGAWDKTSESVDTGSAARFVYTFTPQVKKYNIKVTQTSENGGKVSFSRTNADKTEETYSYNGSIKDKFTIDPVTAISAGTVTLHFEVLGNGITIEDGTVKTLSIPDVTITVSSSGETPSTDLTGEWDKTSQSVDLSDAARFVYTFTRQVKKYSIKVTQTSDNGGKVSFSRTNADKVEETYNYDGSAKDNFTIDPVTAISAGTVTLHFEVLGDGITLFNNFVQNIEIPDVTIIVNGSGETPTTNLTGEWDKTSQSVDLSDAARFVYTFTPQVKKYEIKVTQTSSNGGKVTFSRTDANKVEETYYYDGSAKDNFTIDPVTAISAGTVTLHFEVLGDGITLNDGSVKTLNIPDVTITVNESGETPSTNLTGAWDKTSQSVDLSNAARFVYTFTPQVKKYNIKVTQTSSNGGKVSFSRTDADKVEETYNYDGSAKNNFTIDPVTAISAGTVTLHFEVLGDGITLNDGSVKTISIPDVTITVTGSNSNPGQNDSVQPILVVSKNSADVGDRISIEVSNSSKVKVNWSIDKKDVIDFVGQSSETACVVAAKGEGTAVITATSKTDSTKKATATIRVTKKNPTEVNDIAPTIIPSGTLEVTVGSQKTLSSSKAVKWQSSDPTKVSIGETSGVITAKAVTSSPVTITATALDNNKTATIKVSVVEASNPGGQTKTDPVISSQGITMINVGETIKLTADKDVTWESGDTSIATVDSYGNVKGVGSGTVQIYAKTSDGRYSSMTLTIKTTNTNSDNNDNPNNGGSNNNQNNNNGSGESSNGSQDEQSSDSVITKSGSTANSSIPKTGEAAKGIIAAIGIVVALIAVAIFKKKSRRI